MSRHSEFGADCFGLVYLNLGGSIFPFAHLLIANIRYHAGTVSGGQDELRVEQRGAAQVASDHHDDLDKGHKSQACDMSLICENYATDRI